MSDTVDEKPNVNDTIRNMTAHHRIKTLIDLLPKIVALSKREAERKRKQLEEELRKKRQIDSTINNCPSIPVPRKLKEGLSRLMNATLTQNCTKNASN